MPPSRIAGRLEQAPPRRIRRVRPLKVTIERRYSEDFSSATSMRGIPNGRATQPPLGGVSDERVAHSPRVFVGAWPDRAQDARSGSPRWRPPHPMASLNRMTCPLSKPTGTSATLRISSASGSVDPALSRMASSIGRDRGTAPRAPVTERGPSSLMTADTNADSARRRSSRSHLRGSARAGSPVRGRRARGTKRCHRRSRTAGSVRASTTTGRALEDRARRLGPLRERVDHPPPPLPPR